MRIFWLTLTCVCCWKIAYAQLPNTHVYLFKIEQKNDSLFLFKNPKWLTAFNPAGYNNQPAFFSNNELYITVGSPEDTSQTEIYSLDLKNKIKTRVTASEDHEYSPTILPEKFYFSSVRIEADGNNTQRLWVFPIDRSSNGKPVLPQQENVGYHCWLKNDQVALFIVGDPHQLALGNTSDNTVTILTSNIGRGMQKLMNGNLAYIHKTTATSWHIKELNINTLRSYNIVNTLPGSEDFVIMQDGTLLMASGSKLYKFKPGWDINWLKIADFKAFGLNNITRLAVSEDGKIALVDTKE